MDSLDDLDAVMAEFPFGPFSEVDILPLVEPEGALQHARVAMEAMAPPGSG